MPDSVPPQSRGKGEKNIKIYRLGMNTNRFATFNRTDPKFSFSKKGEKHTNPRNLKRDKPQK